MQDLDDLIRPIDDFIVELSERQKEATPRGDTNFRIDAQRLGLPVEHPNHQAVPHSMYFYYVRVNSNGTLHVTHHFYPAGKPDDPTNPKDPEDWPPIPRDQKGLEELLRMLALDARPSGAKRFPEIGSKFQEIVWQRKSYIAIFIDEVSWKLHRVKGEPSIIFLTEGKRGKFPTPNHSFFDAMELSVEMPIKGGPLTDFRSAVVFINHMKADAAGRDLGVFPDGTRKPEDQFYQFNIIFQVKFADNTDGMVVIFDPDGNNLGPPVAPP